MKTLFLLLSTLLYINSTSCKEAGHDNDESGFLDPPKVTDWYKKLPDPVRTFYVSPNGNGNGSSADKPSNLGAIITATQPGDMVWLLGGDYTGHFKINNDGQPNAPIVYRAMPDEHVKLTGSITVGGNYNWIWGFEITDPDNMEDEHILAASAKGVVLINNILHPENFGQAISAWQYPDQIIYGNIVYHGHHNIYTQNDGTVSKKWFVNNISLDARTRRDGSYGIYEFHLYGEGAELSGYRMMGNIFASTQSPNSHTGGTVLIGGQNKSPNTDLLLESNYFYRVNFNMGYKRPVQAWIRNNVAVNSPLNYMFLWGVGEKRYAEQPPNEVTGNLLISTNARENLINVRTSAYSASDNNREDGIPKIKTKDNWNKNMYAPELRASLFANNKETSGIKGLKQWQEATREAGNLFDTDGQEVAVPTNPIAVVQPNEYEPGRAHIIIYNFGNATSVQLDLSKAVKKGSTYQIHPIKDAWGKAVTTGKYQGGEVTVPVSSFFTLYLLTSK